VAVLVGEAHALAVLGRHVHGAHDALAHAFVRDGHGRHADDELEQLGPGERFPVLLSWLEHRGRFEGGGGVVGVGVMVGSRERREARRQPHPSLYMHLWMGCILGSIGKVPPESRPSRIVWGAHVKPGAQLPHGEHHSSGTDPGSVWSTHRVSTHTRQYCIAGKSASAQWHKKILTPPV